MTESWKSPEEDNMSIGELAEWLLALPSYLHHLPVHLVVGAEAVRLNTSRMTISDGNRHYSIGALAGRATFTEMCLSISVDNND
jgi:hypothetical protein